MKFSPHLYFSGNCESALQFYETCGLGKIQHLQRHGNASGNDQDYGTWRDKVLHAVFEGPALRLCAGDGRDAEPMKGCALLIEVDHLVEARSLFERLSEGGKVTVPFEAQFWGSHYGNFTDRFGVQWAVAGIS
jgi:PhnB protein